MAALAVAIHHLLPFFFPETEMATYAPVGGWSVLVAMQTIAAAFRNGLVAVWVFWVMSAIVLSLRFFEFQRDQRPDQAARYLVKSTLKRYVRLAVPVFASVGFAWILMKGDLMTHHSLAASLPAGADRTWITSLYSFEPSLVHALKNAAFFAGTYNPVLWTMSREFAGSLFLFAFLSLFGQTVVRIVLYVICVLVFNRLEISWLSSFVAGIALCDARVHHYHLEQAYRGLASKISVLQTSRMLAVLVSLSLLFWIGSVNPHTGEHLLIASCIIGWIMFSAPVRSLLATKPLVLLGRISFSLYLLHVPLYCALASRIKATFSQNHLATVQIYQFVTVLVIALVGACVFWWLFDRPSVQIADRSARTLLDLDRHQLSPSQSKSSV